MIRDLTDPVKILAARFSSLPPRARLTIAEKMLNLRDENTEAQPIEACCISCGDSTRKKSLLEQLWDEVEEAHDDGMYMINPFADTTPEAVLYSPGGESLHHPSHV